MALAHGYNWLVYNPDFAPRAADETSVAAVRNIVDGSGATRRCCNSSLAGDSLAHDRQNLVFQ